MKRSKFLMEVVTPIKAGDLSALRQFFENHPDEKSSIAPFAGGTWLHYAAAYGSLETVEFLITLGLDPLQPGALDGELAIVRAANKGRAAVVKCLLEHGSPMDTSASERNPLFAAIVGKAPDVVQLLLEWGIHATAQYQDDRGTKMDAIAFALMRGEPDLARTIALHNVSGNAVECDSLLRQAAEAVGTIVVVPTRIVPTEEDL